ncbi:MAG: thiamine diphosphokinase [Clostridiales bacterium]|jgi:thiamine pyrophosphokinase|nr:thiamine diphosphokinase [Clostridiales bacterium]
MYQNTFLLLNGNAPKDTTSLKKADYIVCADGAFNWAKHCCKPDIIVGDMDSILQLPKDIATKILPKNKDCTDGQIGLRHLIELCAKSITIMGYRGGRADHEFFNYFLLAEGTLKTSCCIEDDDFFVQIVNKNIKKNIGKNKIVSLSPFLGSVHISYTKGLLYKIQDASFGLCNVAPISNVSVDDTIEIAVKSGTVLVFYQK